MGRRLSGGGLPGSARGRSVGSTGANDADHEPGDAGFDRGGAGLALDHPARQHLARDLLGWGEPRPRPPEGLTAQLRAELESELTAAGLHEVTSGAPGDRVTITKTRLERLACDGWQRDPRPYEHTRANVRGSLAHAVIARDWEESRTRPAEHVVAAVWQAEASRRPGDPASLSWWLNHQPPQVASDLRREVAELLETFREVWPPLPRGRVVLRVERPIELHLAKGRVVLRGVPDLVLASPVRDERARTLVVDLKTGRPRPEQDRQELRFYALLVALADDRPPFRWASFYVTEGRSEVEELRADTLEAAVRRVVDGVRQLLRLASDPDDTELVIRAGAWCAYCRREPDCTVAAAARAAAPSAP